MEIIAGLGVRAKTALEEEASEFVIRESSNGNETLSLIHVDDLIQVATSKRDELGNVTIEKHMITKNIETFSHYRYDWLDKYKIFWWIITGIGFLTVLLSSFLSPLVFLLNIGILLFFIGLFLTIIQIADPEYIVFETSSGAHRFLVYRIGSNRPLTNISMDLIDDIMQNYLKTGKLDTSTFDERLLFSMNSLLIQPTHHLLLLQLALHLLLQLALHLLLQLALHLLLLQLALHLLLLQLALHLLLLQLALHLLLLQLALHLWPLQLALHLWPLQQALHLWPLQQALHQLLLQ